MANAVEWLLSKMKIFDSEENEQEGSETPRTDNEEAKTTLKETLAGFLSLLKLNAEKSDEQQLNQQMVGFTDEEIKETKKQIEGKDISFQRDFMKRKLNEWKEQGLHCGITGTSGSGKSSFINAMRNLRGQDAGAAAVGITETTTAPTPYKDPRNPKIVYWDLPGVGTKNFRRNEYLEKVFFSRYDFFIIVSSNRFTENDEWLAMQIQKAGKKFFFVRTKLDQDLANQKRDYPDSFSEGNVREILKETSIEDLEWGNDENPQVYLISNHHQHLYDFPKLMVELLNSLPPLKREALTLSIHDFSNEIVAEKKAVLEKRIFFLSWLSALGGAIPIPGVTVYVDFKIITAEILVYRSQFGLEDGYLKMFRDKNNMTKMLKALSSNESIAYFSETFVASLMITKCIASILPFGGMIGSPMSYYTTQKLLHLFLDIFSEIAVLVLKDHLENKSV